MTIWEDIKRQFQQGDTTLRLVIINTIIFLVVSLLFVPFYLMGYTYGEFDGVLRDIFYLPSNLYQLLIRPWTILTYMFFHTSFLHLFFNMLMLYWFGRILTNLLPNSKILPLYLLGGIAGGILFVIAYNIFPVFQDMLPIVGASASVMAVVLGTATLQPRAQISLLLIGRIELQYFALFLVLLDIIFIPGSNPGGRFAHLGGALMGWFFIFQLQRGRDFSRPINKVLHFFAAPFRRNELSTPPLRRRPQPKVAFSKAAPEEVQGERSPLSGYSRLFAQTYRNMSQEECVDAILEKIKRSGYNSLTEDEKAFLDRSSKEK